MAESLSDQYSSVFSIPKQKLSDPDSLFQGNPINESTCLLDFNFDVNDIEEAINDIFSTAAAGPDGVPAILLKTC